MAVTNVDELTAEMTALVERMRARPSRLGYFAALYRSMTRLVGEGMDSGRFDDPARMEQLTVTFGNRYLAAIEAHDTGGQPPHCWTVAFASAPRWRPLIIQHLLLGINAHINYDLGIAAAEVAPAEQLPALRRDFVAINDLLAELLDVVQDRIAEVSPWMTIFDRVGGRTDEAIANFSMERARDAAWREAEALVALPAGDRAAAEAELDRRVARFSMVVARPGRLITSAAFLIRVREANDPAVVIDALGPPEGG
jgi:hypothetical protein